ncbi:MAG: putative PEP-binding protein [Candidatus Limnocylindrales bacterium]
MAKLEVLQQGDFEGIFRAMDGLPVVVRLIDPPLHEFLPNLEEQLVKVTEAQGRPAARPRRTSELLWRRSRRCTSRTRCSACAAAASG